jgi:hypothetical protein
MSARALRKAAIVLGAVGLSACPSGIDLPTPESGDLPPNQNVAQGFEPGVSPTSPISSDTAVCGALIPGATGQPDIEVMLFAFTTDAAANDATGTGIPLVKDTPPPVDTNGASDVFLAAVVRSSNPGSTVPNAFTQTIAPVMRHPRCIECHSFHYPGGFGTGGQHTGGNSNGLNNGCSGCHDQDIGLSQTGGIIDWRSPTVLQGDFDFRNKTTQQLYDQVVNSSVPDIVTHLKDDDRIFWAIELGIDPNLSNMGDVPITKAQWDVLVDAWAAGGFLFDTSGAVVDMTLVSRKAAGGLNEAGDGASLRPHAVYVGNPAYDPNSTAPQLAGTVHLVFASDATDLLEFVGAPSVARDVWHATIELRMNEEPQAGLPDPGRINLSVRQDLLERMSRSSVGVPGNADSDHPKIANDVSMVVFDSLATNLVVGFQDINGAGAPDVFVAPPSSFSTTLVSHANGFVVRGGNGASSNPNLSPFAEAVVYETLADNLVPPGTLNGARNIALSMPPGAVTTTMVSVDTLGALAQGGDCRRPSVFVSGGIPRVVFESDKTNLVDGVPNILNTQVYVRENGTTRLVTRRKSKSGNGASTLPELTADGRTIVFQSDATNLDTVRPFDTNGVADILQCDVERLLASGQLVIERLSIAPDGSDGDGPSTGPSVANFVTSTSTLGNSLALYHTQATNTGRATNSDAMLVFLAPQGP